MSTPGAVTGRIKPGERRAGSVPKKPSAGPIENDVTYALPDFMERTRWSKHALRTAKRKGLKVIPAGGVSFVRGEDFHQYLAAIAGESK